MNIRRRAQHAPQIPVVLLDVEADALRALRSQLSNPEAVTVRTESITHRHRMAGTAREADVARGPYEARESARVVNTVCKSQECSRTTRPMQLRTLHRQFSNPESDTVRTGSI